ncbi:MAG: peptidoglycan-binding protein [Alphaproteobacteria bacterium]|nr:peptidoglycan-binding protein [Alphaproteobacteria bacterium]MCB9930936.1 peptidoglycan-binding protein [Alphaproteobacteria bacterium]
MAPQFLTFTFPWKVELLYSVSKRILLVGVLALVVSGTGARADDKDGKYAVRGAGAQSCERFVSYMGSSDAAVKRETVLIYDAWFSGYASHVNRVAEKTYDISPIVSSIDMLNLLIQQCARNPKALVETIAAGVLSGLAPGKVAEESELVTVADGENKREYRRSTILAVQVKLAAQKLLTEKPDGRFGPKTSAALMQFQKAEKLPETGFLDARTLLRLVLK